MNDTKKNFLLEKEQQEVFEILTDEEAGKLIKGIFRYLSTGDSGLKGMLNAIFIPIKKSIDKNEKNYKKICERNRENGLKGGRPKKETEEKPTGFSGLENKTQQNPKKPDTRHISYITNHNSYLGKDKGVIGEEEKPFKEIVEYLNKRTGANYKHTSSATRQKINARLNEGFNLDDFIVVIDKKTDEWLEDSEFSKYLCPETLFGTKFEKYLNQKVVKKNQSQKKEKNNAPEWFDKKIVGRKLNTEEERELKELIKNYE